MIKKIINILLVVIIPLLVAFGVGVYGYNRYETSYLVKSEKKGYYDSRIEEKDTESEIKAYLDFYTTYYKELDFENDVVNDEGVRLFTIKGYATYTETTADDGTVIPSLEYMFFAYNMNYGKLYKEIYTTGKQELGAYMPTLSINFVDHDKANDEDEDNDLETSASMTPLSVVELVDYNWIGYTNEDGTTTKKNASGKTITFTDTSSTTANVKVASFTANKEYSVNLDLEITVTDPQYSSYDESTVDVTTISLTLPTQKAKDFDTTDEANVKGYAEDIYEAGYFKYAFVRYIWWEALIGLVLTLIVTVATAIVWNYSDDDKKTVTEKKTVK